MSYFCRKYFALNTELFIARKILFDKENKKRVSKPIITIAIIGIALSLAVMLISVMVVTGFKNEITKKIIGFGSHIQIVNYDSNNSLEPTPIRKEQEFLPNLANYRDIEHIQVYATKPGIIKTKQDIQGILLKGVDSNFDWSFFAENLVEGEIPALNDSSTSNDVLISKYISSLLKLNIGDRFITYFIQDPPRQRVFTVKGIYKTSLETFDERYILADIQHIQKLNNWDNSQISGFEINVDNFKDLDYLTWAVRSEVGTNISEEGTMLRVTNIKDRFPQIFDWLNLQDINVIVILILVISVAIITMISGVIILILEKTNFIGVLKALGTTNQSIKKIFIYQAGYLVLKGLFWGNLIALLISFIQIKFQIIKLDPSTYYLETAPINLNLIHILLTNLATLIVITISMLLPAIMISNIKPERTIRFN